MSKKLGTEKSADAWGELGREAARLAMEAAKAGAHIRHKNYLDIAGVCCGHEARLRGKGEPGLAKLPPEQEV